METFYIAWGMYLNFIVSFQHNFVKLLKDCFIVTSVFYFFHCLNATVFLRLMLLLCINISVSNDVNWGLLSLTSISSNLKPCETISYVFNSFDCCGGFYWISFQSLAMDYDQEYMFKDRSSKVYVITLP